MIASEEFLNGAELTVDPDSIRDGVWDSSVKTKTEIPENNAKNSGFREYL